MDIKDNNMIQDSNQFKPLPFWEELFLSYEQRAEYYRNKRKYNAENDLNFKGLKIRKAIHPFLMFVLSLNRKFFDRQEISILNDNSTLGEKPVIFAITHIGKFDIQIVTEALNRHKHGIFADKETKSHTKMLNRHQYTFLGDPETMYRTVDGAFMNLNGVIYCDTESKEDRKLATETSIELLKAGRDLLLCPEGVWNVTPNLLSLPLFPGIINIAQKAGCDIVPIAIEQYGKEFVINVGKNIIVNPENLDEDENLRYVEVKKQELRDTLASLKFDIIESKGIYKRKDLGNYEELENSFVDKRLSEWINPKTKGSFYNREIIRSRTYKEKDKGTGFRVDVPEVAFSYMKKVKLHKNNMFMFPKDNSLPTNIQNSLDQIVQNDIDDFLEDFDQTKKKVA